MYWRAKEAVIGDIGEFCLYMVLLNREAVAPGLMQVGFSC